MFTKSFVVYHVGSTPSFWMNPPNDQNKKFAGWFFGELKGIGLSVYPPGNLRMREELPLLANPSQLNSFFFTGMAWETYFHP